MAAALVASTSAPFYSIWKFHRIVIPATELWNTFQYHQLLCVF